MKWMIFSALLLLLTGCGAGTPEDELHSAGKSLEKHIAHAKTQSELNILSSCMLVIVNMEKDLIEYRIVNQPEYSKIEKAFNEDCAEWKLLKEKEENRPGEFAGGSMAPFEYNMRMTDFIRGRIKALKQWQL